MARTTMSSLISLLRQYTAAGTADYTAGDATYWTDNQLQDALDAHRLDVFEEVLESVEQTDSGGTAYWKDYRSRYRWFESTDSGTAIFYLQDTAGALQGTANWSADYNRGVISFTADQGGTSYLLTGRTFDVYAAAADVWDQKAAHYAMSFDWSSDNHSIRKSGVAQACLKQAEHFRKMATTSAGVSTLYRSDIEP